MVKKATTTKKKKVKIDETITPADLNETVDSTENTETIVQEIAEVPKSIPQTSFLAQLIDLANKK